MKNIYFIVLTLLSFSFCEGQIIFFNDYNFEQKLIYMGVDTNNNNFIEVSEAESVTELFLNCDGCTDVEKISSLAGIEYFTNLTYLDCSSNFISEIDLSSNINLLTLACSSNLIYNLDLSLNVNLTSLGCSDNYISNLDVSNNVNLNTLEFNNNNTASNLNLVGATNISFLICSNSNLNSLDVGSNVNLDYFDCSYNNFTTLDISGVTDLGSLRCHHMANLTSLNLRNGDGSTFYIIDSNPNLSSICIDNFGQEPSRIQYAIDNFDYPTCQIITDCASIALSTPNFELEQTATFYPNPSDDFLNIDSKYSFKSIEVFDIQGKLIRTISLSDNQTNYTLTTSNFELGVYLIKLSTSKGSFFKKIVKK